MDDHQELFQDLQEIVAHWFTVGFCLKIAYRKLEVIKKDKRDSMDCLMEMLATWLRGVIIHHRQHWYGA